MALHIIVETTIGGSRRWRAEVDPDDGWTRLFEGSQHVASAWFCPPRGWERMDPDAPVVRSALERVAATLERLDFIPLRPTQACERADERADGTTG